MTPHRDRHGRGMRGPLAPPSVPISRTRAEVFDDLVMDAIAHLETRWAAQLENVQIAVEDVPPAYLLDRRPGQPIPLGTATPARGSRPAQIVVYRRPVEARATDIGELGDLVHDVVVEQVADLLGLDPQTVDPDYGWSDEE
ncbi:MAG: metallopeptidase family protein [Acidothermus cellulolyticus]|nr:metallopeptidase family protein [Acidothermus cellulolyticus]